MKLKKKDFLISEEKKIVDALNLIQRNQNGVCFLLKKNKVIKSLTDGDIRRALISGIKLGDKLSLVGNKNFKYINNDLKDLSKHNKDLKDAKIIPVLNSKGACVSIFLYKDISNLTNGRKKIFILGLGYVGLTLGLILAESKFDVFGYDNNKTIRNLLKKKKKTFYENGLQDYLDKYINNNFKILDTPKYKADVHIISVGTPLKNNSKKPNLQHLTKAVQVVCNNLKKNDLIILRSTVPIGTCRELVIPLVESLTNLRFGKDINISFCPERTVEGLALKELKILPQLIGSFDKKSFDLSFDIFNKYTSVVNIDKIESAEIAKLIDNSFRDVIFGYSNQIALISEKYELNLNSIISKINSGYNRNFVPFPSPGVGGPCLTKDPYLLNYSFRKNKLKASISIQARKVNNEMVKNIFQTCHKFLKKHNKNKFNAKIFISGIAFKGEPETSDVRGSTAIDLINYFKKNKYKNIYLHDFCVLKKDLKTLGKVLPSFNMGCKDSDIIIIMNNNKKYLDINFVDNLKSLKKICLFYDTWGIVNLQIIKDKKNIFYKSIG